MKKRLLSLHRVLGLTLLPLMLGAQPYATESVLHHGQFFKIAVSAPGIYKLDATFLSSTAGINLAQTPAQQITLWTNGGGPLPQLTTAPRIDDLREVAMLGIGTADGKVDAGDYFLFYAEGPDRVWLNPQDNRFRTTKNIYDNYNYYFICVSDRTATQIANRTSLPDGEDTFTVFDDYRILEEDKLNLLGRFRPPGSGQRWFGDEFSVVRQRDYEINFPDIVQGSEVLINLEFAGRSDGPTTVNAEFNGYKFNATVPGVSMGNVEADFARIVQIAGSYPATMDKQNIRIQYPQTTGTSSGWLDYIQAQAKRQLKFSGTPLPFRNLDARNVATAGYVISGLSANAQIWDITDAQRPVAQEYAVAGDQAVFAIATEDSVQEFIAFTPGTGHPAPIPIGMVANQNLHSIADADLVIVYHRDFESAALRLAQHRLEHSGYLVEAIPVDQIMNEFGGGGQDPTAIRDFARMLKFRSERFRFLLLFGDGTYDMRYLNKEQNDDNFIPVFETTESMNPIRSFPTDDYFTLLSDGEGQDLRGAVDIAIGRFPVTTAQQADAVVNKIIHYETSAKSLNDWRLRIAYVADDEDNNQHLLQTEDVAITQQLAHPQYNVQKIYLDAYEQVSTPGGARYPDVNQAINEALNKGVLVLNYFGHGGPAGWAQERVLTVPDIQSWTNLDRLALFITATCSFTAYDEPSLQSAGELVFLNPSGGAFALLTTVRAVYSSSNKRLTSEVFERILLDHALSNLTIGEVLMMAKNSNHLDTVDINARKFALIGDPSMFLALPQNDIVITHVNDQPVDGTPRDTVSALQRVQLSGEVRDKTGSKLSQFDGLLYVTIFDKPTVQRTLANDERSFEKDFETQNKVLFKGTATVSEGEFVFSFVVPQDINFAYGTGKVSMYASDLLSIDAAGYYNDLVIGGSSIGVVDTEGPVIQLYVDRENFVSGDETGPNPTIFIKLNDESGINISGSSIGHNLQGMLDNDYNQVYILNDRYVSVKDDHTRGEVTLQLNGLAPGMHTFSVVAWDIANNFSEASIDFRVVDDADQMINNLRNSPNPFRDETVFVFDHRLGDGAVNAEVEVFTTTGRLVHRVEAFNILSGNGTIEPIPWNGTGLSGNKLLPGVYFYRVQLTSRPGTSAEQRFESRFDKLIVLD